MEQHLDKSKLTITSIPLLTDDCFAYFSKALEFAKTNYQGEIDRISNTSFEHLDIPTFFRETAWVIFCSGFRASVVSKFFDRAMKIFEPLQEYAAGKDIPLDFFMIRYEALKLCNNKRKIDAIMKTADIIREGVNLVGWDKFRNDKLSSPEKLAELPFIGKITCFHLARNCGLLDYVKPDLHLVRMAKNWGFDSPLDMCKEIQKDYQYPLGIIDLVLWYSASSFGTKTKTI